MQTLLARIAERVSCRCPQCTPKPKGMSRRAASSAARYATSRAVTQGTFLYSGIIATATAYDARIKNQRREKWDLAIADMRQELGYDKNEGSEEQLAEWDDWKESTQDKTERSKANDPGLNIGHESSDTKIYMDDLDVNAIESALSQPIPETPELNIFEDIQPRLVPKRWPANSHGPINRRNVAPQSLFATAQAKDKALRSRWTPKKMEITRAEIHLLQLSFALLLHERGWVDMAAAAVPADYGEFIKQPQCELQKAFRSTKYLCHKLTQKDHMLSNYTPRQNAIFRCNYHQDAYGEFHDVVLDLNETLKRLFLVHDGSQQSTAALLAKIAYNLTVSTASPNVETYNILLTGLFNAREPKATDYVIRAAKKSHTRLNEVSLCRMLSHYVANADPTQWAILVGRIRGLWGGLALANPDITVNVVGKSRLVETTGIDGRRKVIQKPYPAPMVFDTLISGALKFLGFEKTVELYKEFNAEGWGLSAKGFLPLLDHALRRGETMLSHALLDQIDRLRIQDQDSARLEALSEDIDSGQTVSLETFVAMLRLCRVRKQKVAFLRILEHAQLNGYDRLTVLEAIRNAPTSTAIDDARPDSQQNDQDHIHLDTWNEQTATLDAG